MRGRKAMATPCSHAEFDALPYSVQRKYFSSLERLQIAKQHSLDEHHHHFAPSTLPISRRPSQAASIAFRRSLTAVSRSRQRHHGSKSLQHAHETSQAEALFFLSLPEKLRKQYFSQEEQVLLIGRLEQSQLLHSSSTTSCDSAFERAQQHFSDFHFGFYDDSDSARQNSNTLIEHRGRTRRRSSSVSSVSPCRPTSFHDKNNYNHDSKLHDSPQLQTITLDGDTDSSLLHLDIMTPPPTQQVASPLSGFRRTMSMTTHTPIRNSTSSAPTMMDSPLFGYGNTRHQRAASTSLSGRRSSHTPTAPLFDPEATHYRDPEARKKLRMFLASPQKFDEAVEFGFPSTSSGDDTIAPPRAYQLPPIKTDSRNFSRDMQTFLKDDKISFLEDNEEDKGLSDGDSLADLDSPVTPSSTGLSFRVHPRKVSSSMDSTSLPPVNGMGGRLNREMTLRMTLTRPDLRADEDQLYGWQGRKGPRDDPFALEELHLTDDMTGTKGAFYVKPKPQGNLVTRLFKRASRKGR